MAEANGRPSTLAVLRILSEVGEKGITAPDLARHFTEPEVHQRRNSWVNQILESLSHQDRVRRSDATEKSLHYHGAWTYRWFITAAGREYLAAGGYNGVNGWRAAESAKSARQREEARERRELIISRAAIFVSQLPPGCTMARTQLIRSMRSRNLTLRDIGDAFGISGERVRQIERGIKVVPCRCS